MFPCGARRRVRPDVLQIQPCQRTRTGPSSPTSDVKRVLRGGNWKATADIIAVPSFFVRVSALAIPMHASPQTTVVCGVFAHMPTRPLGKQPHPQSRGTGDRLLIEFQAGRSRTPTHALPHPPISCFHADCAARVLRSAENTFLDSVASGSVLRVLWLVEPLLPAPHRILNHARLSAGRANGSLPAQVRGQGSGIRVRLEGGAPSPPFP